jgi:nicotinamide-nucleotide amidase
MNSEIINIGNELLIGQVVNTNAAWMAEQMNSAGFLVGRISVIADDAESIFAALDEACGRSELILLTGGLGPTNDDITKDVVCRFFDTKLVFHEDTFHDIEDIFVKRGFQMTEVNRKQADLPESCITIPNHLGTARGMWFSKRCEKGTTDYIFMPGVPFEMKAMMSESVIRMLREKFSHISIFHKTILTQGVGESFLATTIEDWENALPENISLAYLPQPGIVRLRLTATGGDEADTRDQVSAQVDKLKKIIPELIFGYDDDKLEIIVGELLMKLSATLATAESCTGGYIAHLITSVSGSSGYFKGSIIAYSNEIKEAELGVRHKSLAEHGAVSEEVVIEMAEGIRKKFGTDYAIATSGIAGPDGGTPEKPVGTTWIAIATPGKTVAQKFIFGEDRGRNIRRTTLTALNMLRKELLRDFSPQ